jgi:hypothetical protein
MRAGELSLDGFGGGGGVVSRKKVHSSRNVPLWWSEQCTNQGLREAFVQFTLKLSAYRSHL